MHLLDGLQQFPHGDVRDDGVAGQPGIGFIGAAGSQAGDDVGVGFVQDEGVWVGLADGEEEGEVCANGVGAEADGGIAFDLAWDEEKRALGGGWSPPERADIVFGEVERADAVDEVLGAVEKGLWEGVCFEELFQGGGGGGIVINADRIHDPRNRAGQAGAETDRAQKSIFEPQDACGCGKFARLCGNFEGRIHRVSPNDHGCAARHLLKGTYERKLCIRQKRFYEAFFPERETHGVVRSLKAEW